MSDILLAQKTIETLEQELLLRKQYEGSRAEWAKSLDMPVKNIQLSTIPVQGSTNRILRLTIYPGNVPDNEWNRKRLPEAFEGR